MARRRSSDSPLRGAARAAGRAATTAAETPARVRSALVWCSWWAGWGGLAALAAIGALALQAEAARLIPLADDELATAAVAALALASLIGWGCMQQGQARIRRLIGKIPAFLVFVITPVAAASVGFATEQAWLDPDAWEHGPLVVATARWVTPVIVTSGLLAFLTWRARPRGRMRWGRGAWWTLLVTPYAALFALVALHVPAPAEVGGPITDSLASLGHGSLAVQLALGYFLGESASG